MRYSLHVPGVAERAESRLRRSFVETHLQIEMAFGRSQLVFGKLSLVRIRHFRAHLGSGVFGMLLRLRTRINNTRNERTV